MSRFGLGYTNGLGDTLSSPASQPDAGFCDPAIPSTGADTSGGALGLLSNLLRRLFARFFPPWVIPPPMYRSFDIQATIATPAVGANGDVLTIQVPVGLTMCARGISIVYSGGGFQQGGGALVYSIRVDGAPVKGYGNILTDLGTMQPGNVQPREVWGIFAASSQTVTLNVSNVAQAGGGTFVVATLVGYFYPTTYHKRSWLGK